MLKAIGFSLDNTIATSMRIVTKNLQPSGRIFRCDNFGHDKNVGISAGTITKNLLPNQNSTGC